MHVTKVNAAAFVLLGASTLTQAAGNQTDFVQPMQGEALGALKKAEPNAVLNRNSTCTLETAGVRRNWDDLDADQRKEYIRAVKSLNTGARVRYDDFAAQHINQTMSVHYWNWFSHQDDLRKSPVFDGSETSMGSDGLFVPHNGSIGSAGLHIPSGLGGGCIATGPFAKYVADNTPHPQQDGIVGVGTADKLRYNPHCVKRDLSSWLATRIYTEDAFLNATVHDTASNIASFQSEIDSQSAGLPGIHAGGHQTISGSNSDLYSGVVDPAFYLHHTMVDRMYWLWQALHYSQAKTISGTITFGNSPPSRNATLEDIIELPFLEVEPATLGGLLDTLDGPYCYIYE
ncbi:N-acetyl-6-hydroxytryptophan oxidase ivoB [Colletotrichum siamense]|uniref:N-acetyl-6-hydroxytryptophan oxidase ivoB n=1 Tax=Colletotrichum siamense TaxID=690259 RepID=UPI00187297FB|nr:N-acetyl-6-hydroxytryptophan oxidase ivoB [Colletotrichum siamense]KAF5489485.1 N-acetyl-6-hydroxytryptophan oxidase ivoB [Colletotrichum siamense]